VSDAAAHHASLVTRLREQVAVPERVVDAFDAVPRHLFLPDVDLAIAYADEAVVTHDEDGIPTSSSSQPSLMARMIERLDVAPGAHVLEIGAGTGYNAALITAMGARVTSVELQPEVADAARSHLAAAGTQAEVVTGDGAHPPPGPFDRIMVTAGAWELAPALVGALADGGILVAPLRLNAIEAVFALRRDGDRLRGAGALPCGFMPLRGVEAARPWRWRLGGGGGAMADADLGSEGRGNLDRLLAAPSRDPGNLLADVARPMDALLWLALGGDPLLSLSLPARGGGAAPWTLGLDVLPASLLVLEFAGGYAEIAGTRLHGGDGALRTMEASLAGWRAAGRPRPSALGLTIEPHRDRSVWSLPYPDGTGASTMHRGAHRWTLRYAAPS
jgi:protein-L-isoaspartate(D-aspartate) O-methyltransferase